LFLATLIALGNVGGATAAIIRKRKGIDKGYSSVPLFSLLFATAAWFLGKHTIGFWAFVPAILDPGTWMLVALPGALIEAIRYEKKKDTEQTSGGDSSTRADAGLEPPQR